MTNETEITSAFIMFDCPDGTTVEVEAKSSSKTETFFVQTVQGWYRSDLGCWITTFDSDGDIAAEDYPDFNFDKIIDEAEKHIQSLFEVEETDYISNNERVFLLINKHLDKVQIVTKNQDFINHIHSSYQKEYSEPIAEFETEEEALEFMESDNNFSLQV